MIFLLSPLYYPGDKYTGESKLGGWVGGFGEGRWAHSAAHKGQAHLIILSGLEPVTPNQRFSSLSHITPPRADPSSFLTDIICVLLTVWVLSIYLFYRLEVQEETAHIMVWGILDY